MTNMTESRKEKEWDAIYNWIRKPDWSGEMSYQDLISWANDRPLMAVMALKPDAREAYLLGEIERLNAHAHELSNEAAHYKDGFKELLEAIMESDWEQLEAGCDGNGPIVVAHKILEIPFSDELVEYLEQCDCGFEDEDQDQDEAEGAMTNGC